MEVSKALYCAATAVAALAAAVPASAQRVDRIVAFGDSYVDDGNLWQLLGIPPAAVYPNGRFSDRTNFVDTMSLLLGTPVDNFGIGGAFTGTGNINGPGIPGFVTEWQSFLAGGGPAAFPRVSGTFDPLDLVVVNIGGNDARAYELSQGFNPSAATIQALIAGAPAQASIRVGETMTGLNALVAAGARNITFVGGDVGRLPEVRGTPVAAVGTAFSSAYNAGMQAQLANLANQGVIVNWLDLNLIGNRIEANPAAFGLTSAGACPISCVTTNPELLTQYLFYVDRVHLTSAGFAIFGRYAVRQLEAPLHLPAQAETGLQAADSFASTLLGRLDLSDARFDSGRSGTRLFLVPHGASGDRGPTFRSLGYEIDSFGLAAGAEYDTGAGFVFGGAVDYSRSEADMETASGRAEARAVQLGLYGGWSGGGAYVEGYLGYGWVDYDIVRTGVIDDLGAETEGNVLTAGGQAGYLFDLGRLEVGPTVGARFARADIDGYTEDGDPALTLAVQDQELDSLVGSAGLEARGDLDVGGLAVRPYAIAAVEREFEGDARTIRYALTAAPGIVNQWALPERSDDLYGRLTAGVNLELGSVATLQLNATTTIEQEEGNDVAGFLALRLNL